MENSSLKALNTFGLDVKCRRLTQATSTLIILDFLEENYSKGSEYLVLGGGSNVLFTGDFDGDVLLMENKGIAIYPEPDDFVLVKCGAGEVWDDLVSFTIDNGLGGLENLVMIPGRVGASPIQNIGAYGVEMKDHFFQLEAIERSSGNRVIFGWNDCRFGYRDSVFKNEFRNRFIIENVTFRLSRNTQVNTSYGAINAELQRMNVRHPSTKNIANAVRNIRSSRLPDPEELGNAGSFFKNPVVSDKFYEGLKEAYKEVPGYRLEGKQIKLAAGWMIEQCGWKGYREGDAGVHKKQALVLVNYGGATGRDILALSEKIRGSVMEKFGVELEREVQII